MKSLRRLGNKGTGASHPTRGTVQQRGCFNFLGSCVIGSISRTVEGETSEPDNTDAAQPHNSGSLVQDVTKLNITLATDADGWDKSANQNLLIELSGKPQLSVTGFVPNHTQKQKDRARELKIEIVRAKDLKKKLSPAELLEHPPDNLNVDILIIHSYGHKLGPQAQAIQKAKKCKWVNVVHTVSEELENFLEEKYANPDANDQTCEHELQTKFCEMSDLVIAIGPQVAEAYRSALTFKDKAESVVDLTPGIIEELRGVPQKINPSGERFRVLLSASLKYFSVKGCDIAAEAIKLLQDSSYRLTFVKQPKDDKKELKRAFLNLGINPLQLIIKQDSGKKNFWPRLLCEMDLVIKPSRTEGFGMSGLRAISAALPVLVSKNCGLGMVLKDLPSGTQHVIDSEDPQVWADAMKNVRAKTPQVRRKESEELRNDYMQKFNWKLQCDELVKKMFSLVPSKSDCGPDLNAGGPDQGGIPSTCKDEEGSNGSLPRSDPDRGPTSNAGRPDQGVPIPSTSTGEERSDDNMPLSDSDHGPTSNAGRPDQGVPIPSTSTGEKGSDDNMPLSDSDRGPTSNAGRPDQGVPIPSTSTGEKGSDDNMPLSDSDRGPTSNAGRPDQDVPIPSTSTGEKGSDDNMPLSDSDRGPTFNAGRPDQGVPIPSASRDEEGSDDNMPRAEPEFGPTPNAGRPVQESVPGTSTGEEGLDVNTPRSEPDPCPTPNAGRPVQESLPSTSTGEEGSDVNVPRGGPDECEVTGEERAGPEAKRNSNGESSGINQMAGAGSALRSVNDDDSNRDLDKVTVTGRSLKVKDISFVVLKKICLKLNIRDELCLRDFRLLGRKMKFSEDVIRDLEQSRNPAYELLQLWSVRRESTVENLIAFLREAGMERDDVATILEEWTKTVISEG